MTTLSDLYDADKARRDPVIARLRREHTIPHPLIGVPYGDGEIPDTTAGRIHAKIYRNWPGRS